MDLDHVDEGNLLKLMSGILVRLFFVDLLRKRMIDRVQVLFHKLLSSNRCEIQLIMIQ